LAAKARLAAAAKDVLQDPTRILAVVPHHDSRILFHEAIHQGLRKQGDLTGVGVTVSILAIRQDMTKPRQAWARMYQIGDTIRRPVNQFSE
jgi:hypothetical protein